ncbi:hypothetical protein JZ785_06905 [Alicyclobacillus curvatus]|nr:hypothetical protein JZ785_06905 [Alicyclobacillus curvatus]
MKKLIFWTPIGGLLIVVVNLILCVTLRNWNLLFDGSLPVGVVMILASAMSLWLPAGVGGGSIFTRRRFQELYHDNPHVIETQISIANKDAVGFLCISVPNILIPIIIWFILRRP